jgi:hypothetical protein
MTMAGTRNSYTMPQKSAAVVGSGPCVAMYAHGRASMGSCTRMRLALMYCSSSSTTLQQQQQQQQQRDASHDGKMLPAKEPRALAGRETVQ